MFLHGGFLHIGSNMLFLWIFGDNVEDRLGHLRYILFYLVCGLGASAAHIYFNWGSTVPSVGASGAIAGVLAGYMLLFPSATVRTLLFLGPFITMTRVPAIIMIGFWFVTQLVSGLAALGPAAQTTGVAFWAHVGGFVVGLPLVLLLKGPLDRANIRLSARPGLLHFSATTLEDCTCSAALVAVRDPGEELTVSGHSKWSQIKRAKGVTDAKRGQLFTKLGREISVAARTGGGPDPDANARLRLAVQRAREANMPMDNIDRAIKRGAGSGDGAALDEILYEGYGPNGAAILIEAMTDNRNRTVAEIRNVFKSGGGSLGEAGCVAWLFDSRGVISVQPNGADPDEVALKAIDAGADDFRVDDEGIEIYTEPAQMETVRVALEQEKVHGRCGRDWR